MTWMTAVRDHPERPAAMQRHVLLCLALRMDWRSGTGWASALQLAADAGVSEHTARRATVWARHPCGCEGRTECAEHAMLHRTSRGHRRGDGTAAASGWELTIPSQPATDGRLRPSQPASEAVSTGQRPASLPATGHRPSRTGSSRPSSSAARERASANGARAGAPETPPAGRCAYCRSDDHEHCTEITPGGPDGCQCPCISGCCEPCHAGDHEHCTGTAYASQCGTPCQCSEHGGYEAADTSLRRHAETCPACEYEP